MRSKWQFSDGQHAKSIFWFAFAWPAAKKFESLADGDKAAELKK